MKTHLGLSAMFLIIMPFTMLTGFASYLAQPQTTLKIAPQALKVKVGEEATIDVALEKVSELYGAQLHIKFDPEVLEVVDADLDQEGVQVEPGTLPIPDFVVQNVVDNQNGTIDYALTQLPPSEPGEGDGVVARVTFRAKKAAVSQVQFDQFLLADTKGGSIEAVPQHGQIRVMGSSTWMFVAIAGIAVALLVGGSVGFVVTKGK
jgi:hypothetical protein